MSDGRTQSRPPSTAPIDRLVETNAIAVVGASPDVSKLGSAPISAMKNLGFAGEIFGVNPRYTEVQGYPCVPTIADLPDHVTTAMIMVPADLAVEAVEACGKKGIPAVVLVAQGFGEAGEKGIVRDQRVLAAAKAHNMAIVGPNTNGVANVRLGVAMSMAPIYGYKDRVKAGPVSVVSQSGAMVSNVVSKLTQRGIGISKSFTCGNELILSMADYLAYLATDPHTDIVVLFTETIRDRDGLRRGLAKCRAAGKPVVALKVGESASGQKAALSHTGAIAGSYQNTVAFLEHEDVAVARDIEMMAAMVELLMRYRWPLPGGPKPFIVSISGGFAALAADEMARLGLMLADPSPKAADELRALPNQSHPVNPYDIAAQNVIIPKAIDIFQRDGFNQLIFGLSLLKDGIRETVQGMVVEAKRGGFDQVYVVTPEMRPEEKLTFQENGITVSEDTWPLFQAMKALAKYRGPSAEVRHTAEPVSVTLPPRGGLLNEAESKAVLKRLGFSVPASAVVKGTPDLAALAGLKRPLVLKGLSNTIAHKSEHDLVALGLRTDEEITDAWRNVSAALAKADPASGELLAEEMAPAGLEAIVGIQNDPAVGPVVIVGAGGILVELLSDAVVLVPPFSEDEVKAALAATRFGKLLSGYRGKSYDIGALARATVALGNWALSEPKLESVDINPLFVNQDGVTAVDAKVFLSGGKS